MRKRPKIFLYHKKWWQPLVDKLLGLLLVLTYLASVVLLGTFIYEHGFRITYARYDLVHWIYDVVWFIFLVNYLTQIIFKPKYAKSTFRVLTWLLALLYLLTLVPVFVQRPDNLWLGRAWDVLASEAYMLALLLIVAVTQLISGFIKIMGRRTNPSLLMAISFTLIILIGSGLFMLPRCTVGEFSYLDSLFLSTSAVCVTGLTPFDVTSTLTPTGFFVLLMMVQVGGLGVMTFTSFFAMFFMGNTSVYNQMMMRDVVKSDSLNSLLSTLYFIFTFTITIELCGAFVIWTNIHGTLDKTLEQEVCFSIFHSVSAFCNSGFSTMDGGLGNSQLLVAQHIPFYLYMAFLIILGGIGFPILVNFRDILVFSIKKLAYFVWKRRWIPKKAYRLQNINTRIVLRYTFFLLVIGTLTFACLEWDGAFRHMSVPGKWAHSFFMAVCPRSAGFSTVNPNTWGLPTLMIFGFLMWIGGGAQSTAGGIKVNTIAVVAHSLLSLIRGSDRVEIFGRELSQDSIRRANATVLVSLSTIALCIFILCCLEPDLPKKGLFFECVAALSTAGFTLDFTPQLGTAGRIMVMVMMFVGRVGLLTLLYGLVKPKQNVRYHYPSGNIIIN